MRDNIAAMMDLSIKSTTTQLDQQATPGLERYSLKRLPMWGWHDAKDYDFDFSWPFSFDETQPDVHLRSITFKGYPSSISSVQCTLSNGKQSPTFEKEGRSHAHQETFHFNVNQPVRSLKAEESGNSQTNSELWNLSFMNQDGNEIHTYNSGNTTGTQTEYYLEDNEQLIGVYGAYRLENSYFAAFGFIVKVRHDY